eukprot:scaffold13657_cov71-Attheya_sp.AAC.3
MTRLCDVPPSVPPLLYQKWQKKPFFASHSIAIEAKVGNSVDVKNECNINNIRCQHPLAVHCLHQLRNMACNNTLASRGRNGRNVLGEDGFL